MEWDEVVHEMLTQTETQEGIRQITVVTGSGSGVEMPLSRFWQIRAWLAALGGKERRVADELGETMSTVRGVHRRIVTDELIP